MRRILLTVMAMLAALSISAQTAVNGKVYDSDRQPAGGVIIRLYENDNIRGFSTSAPDGTFKITIPSNGKPTSLKFISRNHQPLDYLIGNPNDSVIVYLTNQAYELKEVTVKAPERRIKGDTIVYDVAALTKKGDRSIEDVIKKIPGITVDGGGTISYDGKEINHFYIEDLDLMGSKYTIASRSINPADISSVSVYERHQSKKVLQGSVESEKAALNLKLKKGRMLKPIGYVECGVGDGDNILWKGDIYAMLISPKNQTIISAKGNNNGTLYGKRYNDDKMSLFSYTPFGQPSIESDRFLDNVSEYVSANTLFKFGKDLTVKLNTSYDHNHENFDGTSVTEYLYPDGENLIYREDVVNRPDYHNVSASLNAEINTRHLYFTEQFDFSGNFADNSYLINTESLHKQRLDADNFRFSNLLNTIVRSGRKYYEIESDTRFYNSPNTVMSASAEDGTSLTQQLRKRTFFNREHTSFSWDAADRVTVGTSLSFEINHDTFLTHALSDGKQSGENDLSGYRIVTSAEPFIKVSLGGPIWKMSIPLSIYNMKYRDLIVHDTQRYNKLLMDISSSISWRIRSLHYVLINGGRKNNVGDMRDFIDNPIHTTFRNTRTLGTGRLKRGYDLFLNSHYSYRDISAGFYINTFFNMKRTTANTIAVHDVSAGGTSNSVNAAKSHSKNNSLLLNITKNVRQWQTTFYLTGNGIWRTTESMRSSTDITVRNAFYRGAFRIQTIQFNDILEVTADAEYSTSRQKYTAFINPTSFNSLSFKGRIGIFPTENLEIHASANFTKTKLGENNYKKNTFLDAGVRYFVKRFELELAARNLTNMRTYSYTLYNSMDVAFSSYSMRPMEFLLSFKYKF